MNGWGLQSVAQISSERILNALPEGLLIALFAWVLLRVFRRQNSGTRFAVWFLALLAVASLPLLSSFAAGRALVAARVSSLLEWGNPQPALVFPHEWAVFVFVAWALGAGAGMLRLAAGLWRLGQLRRSCTPIVAAELDPEVRKTIEGITKSESFSPSFFGGAAVTIATSKSVRVPSAIGFFKRTIVLPGWVLQEVPAEDLNVILLHELAHLRRWDEWTNLIQKIVRALFFFHPAVWWIEKQLSVEREMACDDEVLAQTENPHDYASCLVSLLEKSLTQRTLSGAGRGIALVQAAVHRAREASQRLARILDKNRPGATRISKPAVAMVGVFSLVCLTALPQASQFVAFNGGQPGVAAHHSEDELLAARDAGSVHSFAPRAASFEPAQTPPGVTPASFSLGSSADSAPAKVKPVHLSIANTKHGVPAPTVAARWNAVELRERVVAAQALESLVAEFDPVNFGLFDHQQQEEQNAPQSRTVVFIESTQYGNSGMTRWNVEVWRVTLLSGERERMIRIPVANSI